MTDNIYVLEDYAALGAGGQVTDDGTGTDWIVIRDVHPSFTDTFGNVNYGAIIYMFYTGPDRSYGSYSTAPGGAGHVFNARFDGLIENAQGGGGDEHIVGNEVANLIYGETLDLGGGNDYLDGRGGNDTLIGAGGSDLLAGGDGNDRLYGDGDSSDPRAMTLNPGNDSVYGGVGDDTLSGGSGANLLDGGDGSDTADYSDFYPVTGDTTYRLVADLIAGMAVVYAMDTLSGNQYVVASDQLVGIEGLGGTAGDDLMVGRLPPGPGDLPVNTMNGYAGDDSYYIYNTTTYVTEFVGLGYDRVYAGVSFVLSANIEELRLQPSEPLALNGTGNGLDNRIVGNELDNILDGAGGNDFIEAGTGNDTLYGMGGKDILAGGAGNDVLSGGGGGDALSGDNGADLLYGVDGEDTMSGGAGNDTLLGGAGNDEASGGGGADFLAGEGGFDAVSGGGGADVFMYYAASDATAGGHVRETILDFASGTDVIDLHLLRRHQNFIGDDRFHKQVGEIRYVGTTGLLAGDLDGDGKADYQIMLGAGTVLVGDDLVV